MEKKTDILEEIVSHKRVEVELACQKKRSMKEWLANSPHGIIAEFKRKSPSKGWIHPDAQPQEVIPLYARYGASALSVLTDDEYFGGSPAFIRQVRPLVDLPILRKDFIVSPYQVYEARVIGADAILLIAAALLETEYEVLLSLAHQIGLEVLLEVHDPDELRYLKRGVPDMLGVNNRHLGTFHTDVQQSFRIARQMKERVASLGHRAPLLVSESGISHPETVRQLREEGFRGFLIGECFMKEENPGLALKNFIEAL